MLEVLSDPFRNVRGFKSPVPEEIAYEAGWIDKKLLLKQAENFRGNLYGEYLFGLVSQ